MKDKTKRIARAAAVLGWAAFCIDTGIAPDANGQFLISGGSGTPSPPPPPPPPPPPSGITLVANVTFSGGGSAGGTTSAIDTSAANFIVINVGTFFNSNQAPGDSKGNTWTALTAQGNGNNTQLWYCSPCVTGAGHTFTTPGAGFPSMEVAAFSGLAASPYGSQESGAMASAVTSMQPGTLTPGQINSLVIVGCTINGGSSGPYTVTGGSVAAIDSAVETGSTNVGTIMGYVVQSTATALNPTCAWTGSAGGGAAMAVFKP